MKNTVLKRRVTFGQWFMVGSNYEATYYINNHYAGQVSRGHDGVETFAMVVGDFTKPEAVDLVDLAEHL